MARREAVETRAQMSAKRPVQEKGKSEYSVPGESQSENNRGRKDEAGKRQNENAPEV
jgi:hypothetical protein